MARPDHRRRNGVLLVAGGLLLVLLAWWRPNPFANPYEVRALFTDAGGLARIGAEVRIAGTTAGEVTSRERRGELALVTMEIDAPEDTVRADARAQLRPRLLFEGTSYVDLDPGSPTAPALGDSAIQADRTSTSVSVADALGLLDAPTRESVDVAARELRDASAPEALSSTLEDAPFVLRSGRDVVTAARGSDGDGLRRAVAGFERTARAVAVARADLLPAAAGMQRTARGASVPALDTTLARLPGTVGEVESGAVAASAMLDELGPLARDLEPAAERLVPMLDAIRPVARTATPVLADTEPLVRDMRGALADAARGAPGARDVVAAASPVIGTFEGGLLDALERPTRLGTPSYLSFLGLFAGGGGASRPFVPGQGHFMRFGFRFLTGVGRPVPPCTLLSGVSPQLADTLAQFGGCQQ